MLFEFKRQFVLLATEMLYCSLRWFGSFFVLENFYVNNPLPIEDIS